MNKKIYLAGPIAGLTYNGATDWREDFYNFFKEYNIDAYSPMRGKIFLAEFPEMEDAFESNILSTQKTITVRDRVDATTCDLMIANFQGAQKVSIGTCIEIGWADANNIPIITIIDDDQLHQHAIIDEVCITVKSVEEAKILTCQFLRPHLTLPKIN